MKSVPVRPPLHIADGDDEKATARMSELRDCSKDLFAQALALLPVQVTLAVALGASASTAAASPLWVNISICLLGLSFCLTAMALSRVHRRPAWTVQDEKVLIKKEALKVAHKGLAIELGAWVLLGAAAATAISVAKALG